MFLANSIHTNYSALLALQGLSRTQDAISVVQKRVNTGYKVADAFDDGAVFAIAQSVRGNIEGYEAVGTMLSRAMGIINVASNATEAVSDTLTQMESVLVSLADGSISGSTRTQYENDFNALRADILSYIQNASFNGGLNLVQSGASNINVVANINGQNMTINARDLQNSVWAVLGAAPLDATGAQNLLTAGFATAKTNAGNALAGFATDQRRITNQINFSELLSDAASVGLGAMVDANLAKEAAKLQSLQIREQIALEGLAIANARPNLLLRLFDGLSRFG